MGSYIKLKIDSIIIQRSDYLKKILGNKKIVFGELLLLLIWYYFYSGAFIYSWEIGVLIHQSSVALLVFVLILSTITAMIEKNNFILISNLLIVLCGIIVFAFNISYV